MNKKEIIIINANQNNNNNQNQREDIINKLNNSLALKNSEHNNINPPEQLSNSKIKKEIHNLLGEITEETEIENEKNKEFFINHPKIYFFLKILLLFEGEILRILVQIGDLYISGIITNIYLEIIIIQLCAAAESNVAAKIFAFISSLIFAYLMKIIVTIAYWELYQLKWFELNPFETITGLLNIKLKNYIIRNIYYITHIILGIIFWIFIISILTMYYTNSKFYDAINLIIFIIIPGLKYLLIYLCYIYLCIINLIRKKEDINDDNPFQYWMKLSNLIDKGEIVYTTIKENKNKDSDNEKLSFKDKIFFKDIIFEIKFCKNKIIRITLVTSIKIFLTFFSFIYIIYLFAIKGSKVEGVFFIIFTYLICLIIWIQFPTPSWFTNSIYRWYLKFKNRYDRTHQLKCRLFNKKFAAFKVLDSLPLILSIIIWLVFIITHLIFSIHASFFITAEDKINQERNFTLTDWPREYFSEIKNIENPICFTEIHGLNILKIISLSYASYIYDEQNTTIYYENSIFKENIEKIESMKFLDKNSKHAVVLMINLDIPNNKPLTVFSVQASIKRLDYWLDLEIFVSSTIFTIIRILTLSKLESLTSKAIIWLLTIPIRSMEKFTLFKKYTDNLDKDIDSEINRIKNDRNIIFTGHSLGGGIAKYLGFKYHKESVSVSGPGITSLEYKFYGDDNYVKYFKSNLIDIVPDYDIVPRLETSGGVRYRVLCEKGFISCHQIERILCQVGAMCRREDLTGELCMSIFGKDAYEEIRDLAGLTSKIPDEYSN